MNGGLAAFAVAASALLWAATAVVWAARQGAFASAWRDWAGLPRLRKALSLVALAALVSWAGTKPSGEIIELSNNRIIESADGSGLSSVGRISPERSSPCEARSLEVCVLDAPQDNLSLVLVGTNEVFDFVAPDGATVVEKWRRRGASKDYLRLNFADWSFPFGGESFSNLVVFAGGRIRLSRDAALCPFAANLGIVPEANWPLLDRINRIDAGDDDVSHGGTEARSEGKKTNEVFNAKNAAVAKEGGVSDLPILPISTAKKTPSLFWHFFTPSNTLVLTWQNALLERETANPVSFQAELFPSGNVVFRYDLSRVRDEGLLTNAVVGVKGRSKKEEGRSAEFSSSLLPSSFFPFPSLTSLSFKTSNDLLCDEARAAFDDAMGGLDPLSFPPGSTNTVWEHYVYTGTTNGAFRLPESTASVAVLRVAVSGAGRGELVVGNRAVPLVGGAGEGEVSHGGTEARSGSRGAVSDRINGIDKIEALGAATLSVLTSSNLVNPVNPVKKTVSADSSCLRASVAPCETSTPPQILLPINRGQTVPLYLRADGTLSVSFTSDDFAFGSLPALAASRLVGRINFPNVTATTPCFHDYAARRTEVTLPVGADADALTCTWTAPDSISVENAPPRSALLTGNFDGRATTPVSYTLAHPDYLFGTATHSQTARFCPPPPEEGDEDGDSSASRAYGSSGGERVPCWHCIWSLCPENCMCCPDCGRTSGREPDESGGASEEEAPDPADYDVAAANCPRLAGVLKIREPLLFSDAIRLEVPDGDAPRCCPCPDHATNFVAVVYKSGRLKVVDADGIDFTRATETVDVRLAGVSPSREVGDAFLSFATNGVVCREGEYTVLGVDIRGEGVDLAALNALNPSFGMPVPVTTNAAAAATLALVTDVGLSGGNVHVGFEGESAPFALWVWDAASEGYRCLASSEDGGMLDVSLATWRKLVGGVTDAATSRTSVLVTAAGAGAADLVFRYWNVIDGQFVEDAVRQRVTAVGSPLRADVNRDGKIDASDAALNRAGRPFRFWFNEDSEKGDYAGQVADATPNASDLKVNGKLDLVNIFPVVVDVSQFCRAWGAATTARLRAVTSARMRYCVLGDGFSSENVLGIATEAVETSDGTPLEETTLTPLGDDGVVIGELSGGSLTSPVALAFEATGAVGGGLTLDILVGGIVVYSCSLPLAISSVDEMYRHADLRSAADNAAFAPTLPDEPWNGPDGETDGRHFVFVHGYNVDAAASRTWARAMFKRLWWAGSRAAFTAVDWQGDDSQMSVPAKGDISPNYYVNVRNAFLTADALTRLCEMLSGEKTLLAHSLGNMLVSSAAVDHGLAYSRYYMLNAAVPMEAYYAEEQDELMVDGAWKSLDERFRASRFAALFASATNDFRCGLSWKGRFNGLRNAVNCYSPTEDVLASPSRMKMFGVQSEDFGGAWAKQELFKGCALWYGVNAATFAGAAIEGGWGVNARFVANPLAYVPLIGFNASYFERYAREDLIARPLYTSFDDERMTSTNLLSFTDAELRAKMLGDAIPAESFAAGANETRGVDDNYDMQGILPNGWPENVGEDLPNGGRLNVWRHSDIKNVAFWYVYLLFKRLLL